MECNTPNSSLSFDVICSDIDTHGIEFNLNRTEAVLQKMLSIMQMYEPEPLLFLVSCGRSAKIIISDLISRKNNIHSFIDTGSVFDGYSGIKSRDYNDPKNYCSRIKELDPEHLGYWMKKGVCERFGINK